MRTVDVHVFMRALALSVSLPEEEIVKHVLTANAKTMPTQNNQTC